MTDTTTGFATERARQLGENIKKTGLVLTELPIGDKEDDPKISCEFLQYYFNVDFHSAELAKLKPEERLGFIEGKVVEAMLKHLVGKNRPGDYMKVRRDVFHPVDKQKLDGYLKDMDCSWAKDALKRSVVLDNIYGEIKNIAEVYNAMTRM